MVQAIQSGELVLTHAMPRTIELTGSIHPDSPQRYMVTMPEGCTVDITLTAEQGAVDTVLSLYESTGMTLLDQDAGSSLRVQSRLKDVRPDDDLSPLLLELATRDYPDVCSYVLRIVRSDI